MKEEKRIDGNLYQRLTPGTGWDLMSNQELNARLLILEAVVEKLREELSWARGYRGEFNDGH